MKALNGPNALFSRLYRVQGTIEGQEYCPCPHCMGHGPEHVQIDVHVWANSEETAAAIAVANSMQIPGCRNLRGTSWFGKPQISETPMPEDERMRAIGAPRLFEPVIGTDHDPDTD